MTCTFHNQILFPHTFTKVRGSQREFDVMRWGCYLHTFQEKEFSNEITFLQIEFNGLVKERQQVI